MVNHLIVESKNDQYFIEALVREVNASIDQMSTIAIDEYDLLDGLDSKKFQDALRNLKSKAEKGQVDRIGIILDLDQNTEATRLQFVNDGIQIVFRSELECTKTGEFIHIEQEEPYLSVDVACYFTQVNGAGELETLLKTIKAQPSPYADCLQAWRECLATQGETIRDKEFDKLWVAQYIRWDTCISGEQKQANKYCSMATFKYVMEHKTHIWDWNHVALDGLKQFLQLFSE